MTSLVASSTYDRRSPKSLRADTYGVIGAPFFRNVKLLSKDAKSWSFGMMPQHLLLKQTLLVTEARPRTWP